MAVIRELNFYKFNEDVGLIEALIHCEFNKFEKNIDSFVIKEKANLRDDFQTLYMEQYLDYEGIKKICDTYDIPNSSVNVFRIIFFIHGLKEGQYLDCRYGTFRVQELQALPKRLAGIIEYEPVD